MPEPNAALEPIIEEPVRRIVAVVQPKRIILFGSAARGQTYRRTHDRDDLLYGSEGNGCAADRPEPIPRDPPRTLRQTSTEPGKPGHLW